jgi:hypothetical protein
MPSHQKLRHCQAGTAASTTSIALLHFRHCCHRCRQCCHHRRHNHRTKLLPQRCHDRQAAAATSTTAPNSCRSAIAAAVGAPNLVVGLAQWLAQFSFFLGRPKFLKPSKLRKNKQTVNKERLFYSQLNNCPSPWSLFSD